jgi:hypothetical protein
MSLTLWPSESSLPVAALERRPPTSLRTRSGSDGTRTLSTLMCIVVEGVAVALRKDCHHKLETANVASEQAPVASLPYSLIACA